jgi:hypothetical protein
MLKKITLKGEQKKVLFLPPTNPIQIKGVARNSKTTAQILTKQIKLFQNQNQQKIKKKLIRTKTY